VAIAGPERAEAVEALASATAERRILVQEIEPGDVVHACISEDVLRGVRFRHCAALADDDASSPSNRTAGIGCRARDRRPPARNAVGALRNERVAGSAR